MTDVCKRNCRTDKMHFQFRKNQCLVFITNKLHLIVSIECKSDQLWWVPMYSSVLKTEDFFLVASISLADICGISIESNMYGLKPFLIQYSHFLFFQVIFLTWKWIDLMSYLTNCKRATKQSFSFCFLVKYLAFNSSLN